MKQLFHNLHVAIAYGTFATAVLVTVAAVYTMVALYMFTQRLPSPAHLSERPVAQSTAIYDRNGELLYQVYNEQNRTLVKLSDLPQHVINATLAAEDANFYSHGGVDLKGALFAAYQTATGQVQGGSTITQQLVKNTLLTNQRSLDRKAKELILSMRLEKQYTKDEILQMYLNEIPYGGEVYGIQAAAKTYLGKDAKDLTVAEAALLAGLPQSPSRYSPFLNPQAALGRQQYVLYLMNKSGFIDQDTQLVAKNQQIAFASPQVTINAPWFTLWVKDQLEQQYGKRMVEEGGLRVTTTLDMKMQVTAEEEVRQQLDRLAAGHANASQASLLSLDPKTGQILAMVGSRDYFDNEYDGQVNGTLAYRQPGSSIKPFVYLTGLTTGKFTTASVLNSTPTAFFVGAGQPMYKPNESDGKHWGPILFRDALANSRNVPAVQVMSAIGLNSMINTTTLAGIPTYAEHPGSYGLSLALGGGETRMIDIATGFMTLANNGSYHPTSAILKIETAQGKLIYQAPSVENEQHFDPRQAYIITNILSDNIARQKLFGANNQLQIGRPAAVKTGTTDNNKDAWTIGFTPNLLTAVWVGNFDGAPMNGIMGSTGATPIWNHFMKRSLEAMPVEYFTRPSGLVEKAITSSGQLACGDAPSYRVELFVAGTEPTNCLPFHLPEGEENPSTQVAGTQIWRNYQYLEQRLRGGSNQGYDEGN